MQIVLHQRAQLYGWIMKNEKLQKQFKLSVQVNNAPELAYFSPRSLRSNSRWLPLVESWVAGFVQLADITNNRDKKN